MGFRIVNAPWAVWQEARIRMLDDDGSERSARIRLRFKILSDEELKALAGDGDADRLAEMMGELVLDWEGVEDADGKPLAFDPALLVRMMGYPFFAGPVIEAYRAAREGRRAKN